ncbi:hypothetical protein KDA_48950 [Dictyobacter alpinus]|uniref:Uncharacterized protein n=1 Tax=Dictyobacter alpinus TaxID=2014873 RepID=A0A402BDD1_9CHLR|nr:hypothetical protein [Dictyobacter alpinus]GCE29411.1 hypothetical protein KDA_48950 [Dictyobacter alpinus]
MTHLYEQYQRGSYVEIYEEFVSMGAHVYDEAFYPESWLVAKAMMERVKYNIGVLVSNLHVLNYKFRDGLFGDMPSDEKNYFDQAMPLYEFPTEQVMEKIKALEDIVGCLPISLKAFYTLVVVSIL